MPTVTAIYLAAAVALYSVLAFIIIINRYKRQISIGDNRQPDFARMVRSHGNFAEYAPITLIAIMIAELAGVPSNILHVCGIGLIIGRSLHAYSFLFTANDLKLRVAGMVLTFVSLWTATGAALSVVLAH